MRTALKVLLIVMLAVLALAIVGAGMGYWYFSRVTEAPPPPVADPQTQRSTAGGRLVGYRDAGDTYAWLGIPYAAPPVAELRWRAPQPAVPWSGVREALAAGPQCPQTGLFDDGEFAGEEDCLYLNIWAPAQPGADRLPVMFWIHGGGNHIGEGASALYNGANLASVHDLVVVSINYRLGPLGWLSHSALRTGDPADDSGNYGLLDIFEALHWVRTNIGAFGGDADNVTIFGESAGGFNVLAAMASPLAKGLYHRAISQSGGLRITPVGEAESSSRELVDSLLMSDAEGRTQGDARALQEGMPAAEIVTYLRGKTAAAILAAQRSGGLTPYLFGDGHVLPADAQPAELFADPLRYNATPVMLGTNRDETKLSMAMNPEATARLFDTLPYRLQDPQGYDHEAAYGSDAWKVRGVDSLAAPLSASQGPTVFAYRFDWDELRRVLTMDLGRLFGAAHALEIPFVFGNFDLADRAMVVAGERIAERDELSRQMMSYWAQFAYTGDPGTGRAGELLRWGAWDNAEEAERLLILDSATDGGVRMSPLHLTMDSLRARLLADTGFDDAEQPCRIYRQAFQDEDFMAEEYATLAGGVCPPAD